MSEETEDKNLSLSEQQERENRASIERQRKSREEGRSRRAARKAEREALANAESSSERREIKERFDNIQDAIEEGAIFDVDTGGLSTNQGSLKDRINDDGIDTIAGAEVPEGFSTREITVCEDGSAVTIIVLVEG